jgi:hypothetical protein
MVVSSCYNQDQKIHAGRCPASQRPSPQDSDEGKLNKLGIDRCLQRLGERLGRSRASRAGTKQVKTRRPPRSVRLKIINTLAALPAVNICRQYNGPIGTITAMQLLDNSTILDHQI